ncbi:hypothetical protein [Kineococcus sp. SYSU DK003]|uniref:hypothetical protein n=1 Tax=Kineococcus sp. SYSU DK003 TaxID=3383124 RepID=UPI003D7D2FB4
MTVLARPATRRVLGAAAALALGAGVAAATPATAADRPARTVADVRSGAVTSKLVAVGDALAVRSTIGPLDAPSYVQSSLYGKVTAACFDDGAVVPGTGRSAGWIRTGSLDAAPFQGGDVEAYTDATTAVTTISADVVLKGILRDRAGDLEALDCAEGTTAGWYRYRITALASSRATFDGTVTGTYRASLSHTYSFPAPPA